ncbi:phospholipase A1-like [Episyrphus balteatus]|uniref:phospholipase A1-like n=1 Tax=Episyrphus balteatus TaxID=286459 RepID=UPI0024864F00|nr:phospholipase A1-like [Episyrphus balteatus]
MKVHLIFITLQIALGSTFELSYILPDDVESWYVEYLNDNITEPMVERSLVENELTSLEKDPDLLKYFLWTQDNPTKEQRLILGDPSTIQQSHFNKSNPTRIMIHGIRSSHKSEVCTIIRDAHLKKGPYNFICMDWSKIAYKSIPTSRLCMPSMGYDLAKFIEFLIQDGGISKKNLIVMAHSYGTHIAGNGGKYLKKWNNTLPLIIVCDPAKALYTYKDCSTRICYTDADFVLSIQTTVTTAGFARPIGGGAYYPNGGYNQPGCPDDKSHYLCSHLRSYKYLAEAILKNDFPTIECKSYKNALRKQCGNTFSSIRMASEESFGRNGTFYVPVNSKPPYGKG